MPKIDGFLIALIAVIAASLAMPELGASGGPLHLEMVARWGIAVVFFLYGLTLAPERLKAGALHWRLHLLVQGMCFIGFPLLVIGLGAPLKGHLPDALWLGFLYLAALPGTIASAVAMTGLARGNVPAAVFNATISGLIAVVATPALMALTAGMTGVSLPLGAVILKVVLLIVLPMALGQLARRWLAAWAGRNARWLKPLDRAIILAIVANAFCDAMVQGLWTQQRPLIVLEAAAACIALFWIAHGLTGLIAGWLGLDRADRIAALLSATQKSLATGVPLAPVIFGPVPQLGLIILPIMLYHLAQLITVGVLAGRWQKVSAP